MNKTPHPKISNPHRAFRYIENESKLKLFKIPEKSFSGILVHTDTIVHSFSVYKQDYRQIYSEFGISVDFFGAVLSTPIP